MMKSWLTYLLLLLLLIALAGCSAPAPVAQQRYFFPPPPLEPKIEFIKAYFSDYDLRPDGRDFLTTYVLGETQPDGIFASPVDVASDGKGRVYVADSGLRTVIVLDLKNNRYKELTSPQVAVGVSRGFGIPIGVTVASDGKLYVSDVVAKGVEVYDPYGGYQRTIKSPEEARPTAAAVDVERNRVYVVYPAEHRLGRFDLQGKLLGYLGERGVKPGQFNFPTDVDIDEQGNLYVLDSLNARVQVFDAAGTFIRMFGERGTAEGSFSIPKNLAVSKFGQVYVTDAMAHKLVIFSTDGQLLLRIGGKSVAKGGISPGGFYLPRGLDVDDNGGIWVADTLNKMVHHFQFLTPDYLREHPVEHAFVPKLQ
jgi:sugar lactone lactonase YvrE